MKYWWMTVLALLSVCCLTCMLPVACSPSAEQVISRIPMGSKLGELDRHFVRGRDDEGEVTEWIRPGKAPSDSVHRDQVKNEFGQFLAEHIGSYDGWNASDEERDSFTGKITFYHHSWVIPDDLAPSYMIELVYIHGELKSKNWGILPG